MTSLCLFCEHPLDGQSKKYCITCLPPYGECPDRSEYQKRYAELDAACGLFDGWTFPRCDLPMSHLAMHRECRHCSDLFEVASRSMATAYCSDECRRAADNERHKKRYLAIPRAQRTCRWCFTPFAAYAGASAPCCSGRCRTALTRHVAAHHSPNSCPLPVCIDCGQVFGSPPSQRGNLDNGNRCRTCRITDGNVQIRQIARLTGDRPTIERLAQRDGWQCHICQRRINPRASRTKDRATIDHLIPISAHGEDTMQNTRLAHQGCNSRRGVTGPAQLRLIG
jgi:hypothetical protein